MSRSFGVWGASGFFHQKILNAADDLKDGAEAEISKQYIPLLEELYEIAYTISAVEDGDSGEYAAILESMRRIPRLKEILTDIEIYLEPFRGVAEKAVRDHIEKEKSK